MQMLAVYRSQLTLSHAAALKCDSQVYHSAVIMPQAVIHIEIEPSAGLYYDVFLTSNVKVTRYSYREAHLSLSESKL